jgi:D-glycerate 3-kinase
LFITETNRVRPDYYHPHTLVVIQSLYLLVISGSDVKISVLIQQKVSTLSTTLRSEPYNLNPAVISLDDFYLRHDDQLALASAHADNPIVQHRGQPSTHDLPLLRSTLASLRERRLTKLPSYDKSLFSGAGDRTETTTWEEVNRPGVPSIDVIVLEGWCLGFRALTDAALEQKWQYARTDKEVGQLGRLKLKDVQFINKALKGYDDVWE